MFFLSRKDNSEFNLDMISGIPRVGKTVMINHWILSVLAVWSNPMNSIRPLAYIPIWTQMYKFYVQAVAREKMV